ncbi:class I SAM-dependent methyltransferase [Mycolicibacterium moriokaense]|nr:class I SAM-dependent methyltransferase [Mycolicibacterium moriokaense]
MAGRPWDASYRDGPAPWNIGRAQPAVVRLASAGAFSGTVLDAGCGTGDNALHLASLGLGVTGVDVAADALRLADLGRTFDTVLDCGLLHTFDRGERSSYAASLASVTRRGGTRHVLCFSDQGPDTGPHPLSRDEVDDAFTAGVGWQVVAVEPDRIHTRFHGGDGAPAWCAAVERV